MVGQVTVYKSLAHDQEGTAICISGSQAPNPVASLPSCVAITRQHRPAKLLGANALRGGMPTGWQQPTISTESGIIAFHSVGYVSFYLSTCEPRASSSFGMPFATPQRRFKEPQARSWRAQRPLRSLHPKSPCAMILTIRLIRCRVNEPCRLVGVGQPTLSQWPGYATNVVESRNAVRWPSTRVLFCIFALRHSQFCQFPPRLHCRYDWVNPRGRKPHEDGASSGARCDVGGGSKFQ